MYIHTNKIEKQQGEVSHSFSFLNDGARASGVQIRHPSKPFLRIIEIPIHGKGSTLVIGSGFE